MLKAAAAKVYQTGLALMLGAAFALASPAALAFKAPETQLSAPGFEALALEDLPRDGRTTYGRASHEAITVNTRYAPPELETAVRGVWFAGDENLNCPMPAFIPATTTTAFSRSSHEL